MDNRTKILKVALELFCNKGYNNVGVMEIVKGAGVTKPTLYYYFGSKRGLLEKLLEENFAQFIGDLRRLSVYGCDLTKSLQEITSLFFSFAQTNKEFYRMQLSMNFSSQDSETLAAVSPYNDRIFRLIEQMFADASRDHGNMKGRQSRYAVTFIGMINNYITLALNDHIKTDSRTIYDAVHQFSHGIYS